MSSIPRRPLPMELLAEIFHNIRLPKSDTATIEDCDQIVQIFLTSKCALQFAGRPMFKKQLKHLLIRLIGQKIDELICNEINFGWDIDERKLWIEGRHLITEEAKAKEKSEIMEVEEMLQKIGHQIQELSFRKKYLILGLSEKEVGKRCLMNE